MNRLLLVRPAASVPKSARMDPDSEERHTERLSRVDTTLSMAIFSVTNKCKIIRLKIECMGSVVQCDNDVTQAGYASTASGQRPCRSDTNLARTATGDESKFRESLLSESAPFSARQEI